MSPASASERFLRDFHDRLPGGSPRAFAGVPVTDDQGGAHADTYHALVQRLQDGGTPAGPVLDLACGDGHLLALLRASGRAVQGVDFSHGELAAARTRLGAAVPLLQAQAQALPLADASLAAVTCHMALMLMDRPAQVLAELRRVLLPGGRLLAVVPQPRAPGGPDPLTAAFWAALDAHPQRQPDWQAVRFGTPDWRSTAAIASLLAPAFGTVRLGTLAGTQRFTPAQAWQWFTGLYDLHLRPDAAWAPAEALFHRALAPHVGTDGQLSLPHAYLLIDAARPPTLPP